MAGWERRRMNEPAALRVAILTSYIAIFLMQQPITSRNCRTIHQSLMVLAHTYLHIKVSLTVTKGKDYIHYDLITPSFKKVHLAKLSPKSHDLFKVSTLCMAKHNGSQ